MLSNKSTIKQKRIKVHSTLPKKNFGSTGDILLVKSREGNYLCAKTPDGWKVTKLSNISESKKFRISELVVDNVANFKNNINTIGKLDVRGTSQLTGDTTITSGDIVFATAGKGICLGVTSNTDANTLDDYEEGTFSPSFGADNQGFTVGSTATATGKYVKVGSLVHFN